MRTGFIVKYKRPREYDGKPEYVVAANGSTEFTNKRSEATLFKTGKKADEYLIDHGMNPKKWIAFKTTIEETTFVSNVRKPRRSYRENTRAS